MFMKIKRRQEPKDWHCRNTPQTFQTVGRNRNFLTADHSTDIKNTI